MTGIALGAMRLSLDDFDRCSPCEFSAIWERWRAERDEEVHRSWEQSRYQAYWAVRPYTSKINQPSDLGEFAWESERQREVETNEPTMEELRARYRAAVASAGINQNETTDEDDEQFDDSKC